MSRASLTARAACAVQRIGEKPRSSDCTEMSPSVDHAHLSAHWRLWLGKISTSKLLALRAEYWILSLTRQCQKLQKLRNCISPPFLWLPTQTLQLFSTVLFNIVLLPILLLILDTNGSLLCEEKSIYGWKQKTISSFREQKTVSFEELDFSRRRWAAKSI